MATKLEQGKSITREINIRLLPEPINVTMSTNGLEIRAKGCRKSVTIGWSTILDQSLTPSNVPAKLFGKALEYLRSQMKQDGI